MSHTAEGLRKVEGRTVRSCRTDRPGAKLCRIAETDDLHIVTFREDKMAYDTPSWIWSVVVDEALYVRASRWYRAAARQKAGRITAKART